MLWMCFCYRYPVRRAPAESLVVLGFLFHLQVSHPEEEKSQLVGSIMVVIFYESSATVILETAEFCK